jgi:DNA-binding NarL/FixJ family response regulator
VAQAIRVEHITLTSVSPGGPLMLVRLSPREAQVLLLICQAKPNKAIAFRLQISTGVVKNYVSRLCRGLDLSSRAELFLWGMQHPEFLMREFCDSRPHPTDCLCQSAYCSAMRLVLLPTAA